MRTPDPRSDWLGELARGLLLIALFLGGVVVVVQLVLTGVL